MSTPAVREFFDFVKAIGESKSKQEEDRIIGDEILYLKKVVPEKSTNKKKLKELVIRALYVEMLGQDASFAYIKTVELCASTNIVQKKAGYLTAALFLSPTHDFRFMLVNQIQRDMNSANHLEVCTALTGVSKLITEDMIPAVITDVVKLFKHDNEAVRKKAVGALHRLYQLDKSSTTEHIDKLRRALCDKDPSVMSATLPFIFSLATDDVNSYRDLVHSLVSILKQIIDHRLPRDFDYHRIPAPWIQMSILRILSVLGKGDQSSSENMYEILIEVMKRADTGINVGYAIVYECVKTVTSIYPNPTLLDSAATAISRFIRSDSHNLKYIGIKGLALIVKENPRYAADHQLAVIDCLEDPDETLKRKTLDLLLRMTNAMNVEFIVDKLLSFLGSSTDDHFRSDLVGQITQCAERYAPSNAWYVSIIVKVFELAGDKVKPSVAQTLTQLIAEGAGDDADDSGDDELRSEAVEDFIEFIGKPKLPELLAQTMAWVLGEYGYLSQSSTKEVIMDRLCHLAAHTNDGTTRSYIITALMKLVAQNGSCPPRVNKLVVQYCDSIHVDLQQRCMEFKCLLQIPNTMVDVLPVDASCEDIEVDQDLSFLDAFVNRALSQGAAPYAPPRASEVDDSAASKQRTLNFNAYEKAIMPVAMSSSLGLAQTGNPASGPTPLGPAISNPQPIMSGPAAQGNQLLNIRSSAQVWGKKAPEPVVPATPAPAVSTSNFNSNSIASPVSSSSATSTTSSNSSPAVQSAPAVPAGPRELTEKEKMAQALFGGGPSKTSGISTNRRKSQVTEEKQSVVSPSINNSAVSSSFGANTAAPAPAASGNLMDLLDMDVVAAPRPPVSSSTAFDNDILSFNNVAPPKPPVSTTNILDSFVGMEVRSSPGTTGTGAQPLNLTTAQFGPLWVQNPGEVKQSVNCQVKTLESLRAAVPPCYKHVESIVATQEAIFAATASTGQTILMHFKLQVAKFAVDVTVKSTSRDLCTKEYNFISTALQSFK